MLYDAEQQGTVQLEDIMDILLDSNCDRNQLLDAIYHHNKSVGVTLIKIRKALQSAPFSKQQLGAQRLRSILQHGKEGKPFLNQFRDF